MTEKPDGPRRSMPARESSAATAVRQAVPAIAGNRGQVRNPPAYGQGLADLLAAREPASQGLGRFTGGVPRQQASEATSASRFESDRYRALGGLRSGTITWV